MSITQSTLKTIFRDGDDYSKTYYGFSEYNGTTDTVAIVKHEGNDFVFQVDPMFVELASDGITEYLSECFMVSAGSFHVDIYVTAPVLRAGEPSPGSSASVPYLGNLITG